MYRFAPDGVVEAERFEDGRRMAAWRTDSTWTNLLGSTSFAYDPLGRLHAQTDARNGTTQYTHDAADRVVTVTTPSPGTGEAAQTTTTEYDALGRPWRLTHPDGTSVTNEFYATGLLRRTSGSRTYPVEYTYDAHGRMKTMKTWEDFAADSGPETTTWNYDANRGWLLNKRYSSTYGPDYTYTAGGRLKTRMWARTGAGGRITATYKYGFDDSAGGNEHGDVVQVSYNDALTPTLATTYDRLGRVRSLDLGSGSSVLSRFWHPSGLPLGEAYSAGPLNGLNTTNTYDAFLRRTTLAARNGSTVLGQTLTNSYDNAGRLQSVSDGTYSGTYAYLPDSSLWETLTFKGGSTVRSTTTRRFDFLGRLQSISTVPAASAANPLAYSYVHNAANQRIRRGDPDAAYWVYRYDALGQVISGKKYWSDGTPVAGQQFEYAYDDIGNRTETKEGGDDHGTGLRSTEYWCSPAGCARLLPSAVDVVGVASPTATVTVNGLSAYRRGEYFHKEVPIDNQGTTENAITVQAVAGTNSVSSTGTVLSPYYAQYCEYDSDGNLANDDVWAYAWDGENRLLSMETSQFSAVTNRVRISWEYDPVGRRCRQLVAKNWNGSAYGATNETRYVYDGWACIAELNSGNTLLRQYAWGLDLSGTPTGAGGVGGLLWMRPAGGPSHFSAYDANGNVTGLVDGSSGVLSARYEFDPFGKTIRLTGPIAKENPFRFSTKRADDITGLIHYEYRSYSPDLGRWPNRDPIGERGGVNLYGFVANAPTWAFDALGAEGWPPSGGPYPPVPVQPPIAPPPPPAPLPMDRTGFELCRRDALGNDFCTRLANFRGGIHSFVRRRSFDADGKPRHDGWGFDDGNEPRPEPTSIDPLINPKAKVSCASCTKTSGVLQHGTTGKGKRANAASDDEIWQCVVNTPKSRDYDTLCYNCQSYALEAASQCGLSCPKPVW